ncbi:MAG: MMPL family transporter [Planctomycetota bacterium]|nr:MMPL family transporter [Planctomycetota bacterium]
MNWFIEQFALLVSRHRPWGWAFVCVLSMPPAAGLLGYHRRAREQAKWAEIADYKELPGEEVFQFVGAPVQFLLESDGFFQLDRIAAIRAAVTDLEQQGMLQGAFWLDTLPTRGAMGLPGRLLPKLLTDKIDWQAVARRVAKQPLAANHLVSADGRALLLLVAPTSLGRDSLETIRQHLKGRLNPTEIRVRMTGLVPIQRALVRASDQEHLHIQLTAYAAVVVLALLIFRKWSTIVIAVSGPALGTFWALGWLALLGEPHSDLDPLLPVMFAMIGFTDSVHLVVHLRQERLRGTSQTESARLAATHIGKACLLTSLTTAIGFGSLIISDAEVVQAFGRGAAIGVFASYLAVILIVPLLGASSLGKRIHLGLDRDLVTRHMERLAVVVDWIVPHARWVSAFGILATGALTYLTLNLTPDDWLGNRIDTDSEAYRAMLDCEKSFGGIEHLRVVLHWPENARQERILELIEAVEQACADQPELHAPISIRPWQQVVPLGFLPQQVRDQFWRPTARRAQVAARHGDLGIATFAPAVQRLESRLKQLAQNNPGYQFRVVSPAMNRGMMIQGVVRELFTSLALASLVIFAVLALAFKSLRLGMVAVIPNLFPLVATGGIRLFWNPTLDIASACAFTVCLGIAVDDTIHFLARYQHESTCVEGLSSALRRTFVAVGNALVMTTIVLVAGFASVFVSPLPTHHLFASVACTTIAAALFADLVLLPALLAAVPSRHVTAPRRNQPLPPDIDAPR